MSRIIGTKEIIGNDELRVRKCGERIQHVLEELDCMISPKIILTPGRVDAELVIQAKPRVAHG